MSPRVDPVPLRPHALVAPALLVLIAAACQPQAQATDPAEDEETVRRLATEWAAAEASNDIDAAVSFMWEDAVMQPPNAPQVQGHAAIRELYGAVTFVSLDPGPLTAKASGELAVVWSPRMTYTLEMAGDTITDEAKFVAVWERRDGEWKVLENSWSSNLAPGGG